MKAPLFSILHTSARPDKWRAVYDDWMSKAVHPEDMEYVLCIDPRWGFDVKDLSKYDTPLDNVRVVLNNRRRCYVDGVNIAAEGSMGSILIVNADDQFACENWDELLSIKAEFTAQGANGSFVIEVSTGTPHEHERGVMVMPILSRARYQAQGYVFYPEYESMFADNDFCETARQDGVVIDARHLMFPHRHPMFDEKGPGGWSEDWQGRADVALRAQNRPEAYKIGKEIYARRKASGFPPMQHGIVKRTIALCLPGEHFHGAWVGAILSLQAHLILNHPEFQIVVLQQYTSNPYVTREDIRRGLAGMNPHPDLCLWLDDDNVLSVEHFEQLLKGIESHPEVDGISAWCWIHSPGKTGFVPSAGNWAPDHLHWDPFPASFAHRQGLEPFECGGLPCILMRYSALEKAGDGAFLPVLDSRLEHGILGEDFAFFRHAEKGGASFLVDPQVRIPHLKYVTVEPVFSEDGRVPVKVACMMRVKNEARWIKHTIESVRELCGDLIYVMEDGSTDDTRAIAEAAGAVVLDSPFVDMGLDEARDKNWLMDQVLSRCSPDWILMPDGDEELEPGGCAKIRRALETNPACDCFALRFLYFWNRLDQVRVDGVYGKMARQSLFRADSTFKFKSYYSKEQTGNQNHVGLHTSNAPGLGGRVMNLNVALLHYGYLHRQDRIAKYKWILSIDPHNEGEDLYRHCVQGDLPEFPADAEFLHAGPLKLQKLPAHLVPKFDIVPGPRESCESWATPDNAGVNGGRSPELAAVGD
jgi:glycosyltransferase involved in cell wall biosynthesis